jgi:hypothetical protein
MWQREILMVVDQIGTRKIAVVLGITTVLLTSFAMAASCVIAGCSKQATFARTDGASAWIANGATACDRYFTHDVVSMILTNPAGATKTLSTQACSYETSDSGGTLTITLTNAGPAVFDDYQKYLVNPESLPGVGDKASQSVIGITAVKGADRSCSIDAVGAPGSLRLRGAELGQKLGAICNQLFALP